MACPALADPICTDRPGRGTTACTAPEGHFQVETSLYDVTMQRRGGVTTDITLAAFPLVKYGVTDRFDIEAALPFYQASRVHDASGTATDEGTGDLLLRAKYNLSPTSGWVAVLDPWLKLPTAGPHVGNGAVEGGLVMPIAHDLGGGWQLDLTPEADLLKDATGNGHHAFLAHDLALAWSVTDRWTLGADVYAAQNLDPTGGQALYSLDADTAFLLDDDTQIDCGANFGLNRATPDAELYVGFSRRF